MYLINYKPKEEQYKSFLKIVMKKRTLFSLIVGIIGIAFAILFTILNSVMDINIMTEIIILYCAGGFLLIYYIILNTVVINVSAKKNYEKNKDINVSVLISNNTLTEINIKDGIEIAKLVTDINTFKKIQISSNCFYLYISNIQAYILPKESFVEGTVADFEKFMIEKNIKVEYLKK